MTTRGGLVTKLDTTSDVGTITLEEWKRRRDEPAAAIHVVKPERAKAAGE